MPPGYTGITVEPDAADELRVFGAKLTGRLGRRVNNTQAVRAAVRIATAHLDDDGTLDLLHLLDDEG